MRRPLEDVGRVNDLAGDRGRRRNSSESSTWIVPGTACKNCPVERQAAMSVEPRPVLNAPSAP